MTIEQAEVHTPIRRILSYAWSRIHGSPGRRQFVKGDNPISVSITAFEVRSMSGVNIRLGWPVSIFWNR